MDESTDDLCSSHILNEIPEKILDPIEPIPFIPGKSSEKVISWSRVRAVDIELFGIVVKNKGHRDGPESGPEDLGRTILNDHFKNIGDKDDEFMAGL